MPLADYVLDNGLASIAGSNRRLDITHTLATTYAQATTDAAYSVGNKTGLTVTGPAARAPNGRQVTVPAITDGAITETGASGATDAEFWALTDPANSRLLCTGSLAAAQFVTDGNQFSTNQFTIGIPNQ
jgi:ketosteroid isomerase-like protein